MFWSGPGFFLRVGSGLTPNRIPNPAKWLSGWNKSDTLFCIYYDDQGEWLLGLGWISDTVPVNFHRISLYKTTPNIRKPDNSGPDDIGGTGPTLLIISKSTVQFFFLFCQLFTVIAANIICNKEIGRNIHQNRRSIYRSKKMPLLKSLKFINISLDIKSVNFVFHLNFLTNCESVLSIILICTLIKRLKCKWVDKSFIVSNPRF